MPYPYVIHNPPQSRWHLFAQIPLKASSTLQGLPCPSQASPPLPICHPPPCPRSPSLHQPTFRPGQERVLGVRLERVFPKNAFQTRSKRIHNAFPKRIPNAFQKTANLVSRPSAPENAFRKRDPSKKAFQTRPRSRVYSLIPSKIVDLSVPQDTPDATCENIWASPLRNLAMNPCRRH